MEAYSVPATVKALGDLLVNQLDEIPFLRELGPDWAEKREQ